MQFNAIISAIDAQLPTPPHTYSQGSLLIMVGLPGAGKSSIVGQMAAWCDFVVIQTDWIRKQLDSYPTYTNNAMASIYDICYALIAKRLQRGQWVVFDASNYLQARRQRAVNLAQLEGATMAICRVQASQTETYKRLQVREQTSVSSDADWAVYQWMVENQEPLIDPHLIIDSSSTPVEQSAHTLHAYWMAQNEGQD